MSANDYKKIMEKSENQYSEMGGMLYLINFAA